jgi:hypothetical protein
VLDVEVVCGSVRRGPHDPLPLRSVGEGAPYPVWRAWHLDLGDSEGANACWSRDRSLDCAINEGTPPSMSWRGPVVSWCDVPRRAGQCGRIPSPRHERSWRVGPPVTGPRLLSVDAARYRVRTFSSTPCHGWFARGRSDARAGRAGRANSGPARCSVADSVQVPGQRALSRCRRDPDEPELRTLV